MGMLKIQRCRLVRYLSSQVIEVPRNTDQGQQERLLRIRAEIDNLELKPRFFIYAALLRRCAEVKALDEGKRIHIHIIKAGYDSNIFLRNIVMDMYGKCGCVENASLIFERTQNLNVYSWTIMISSYTQNGYFEEALHLYKVMLLEGIKLDKFTFSTVLSACCSNKYLLEGRMIHSQIAESGLKVHDIVGTALTNMYGKCGSAEEARHVFDTLNWNPISCTAMITAYAQNGLLEDAIQLYREMDLEGLRHTIVTYITIVDACADAAALSYGRSVHSRISEKGVETDFVVGTALVHFYGRCGSLNNARSVFERMPLKNVITWNAIMAGYCEHGHGKEALYLCKKMVHEGIRATDVTFISVLFACSHEGWMEEACGYFVSMQQDHATSPRLPHYGCMIDVFGRAGWLNEAEHVINSIPSTKQAGQALIVPWLVLLAACTMHNDGERACRAARNIFKLNASTAAPYSLLSNIYSTSADDETKQMSHIFIMLVQQSKESNKHHHLPIDNFS